ncbi:hypothetical protein J3A83DRAFT_4219253 [Scleroderma citrinum]
MSAGKSYKLTRARVCFILHLYSYLDLCFCIHACSCAVISIQRPLQNRVFQCRHKAVLPLHPTLDRIGKVLGESTKAKGVNFGAYTCTCSSTPFGMQGMCKLKVLRFLYSKGQRRPWMMVSKSI